MSSLALGQQQTEPAALRELKKEAEPTFLAYPALAGEFFTAEAPGKHMELITYL